MIFMTVFVPALCFAQMMPLEFRPSAAEYSASLDRIIMVSTDPSQLHIYTPNGPTDTIVSLPKPPLSLAVSPDGLYAAVGHDALISYVNLSAGTVEKTIPIPVVASNVTMSGSWIYVIPRLLFDPVSVNIATGAVTRNRTLPFDSAGRLNTAVNAIYGTFSDDIRKYDISTGPITKQTASLYRWGSPACWPVFFSPDGGRIYTGCGTVFQASTDASLDMRYVTTLTGVSIRSLTESAAINRVALIQGAPNFSNPNDNVVLLYESDYLNPVGQFALVDFTADSRSFKAHGKWVFFNSASTALYVVVQADLSSGFVNDFAVQTISLAQPFPCGASFASPNAEVISSGVSGTVDIVASPACRYQAVSAPWIEVVSGSYGSGNTTLRYIVRPNPGGPRAGTISIGLMVFTITQAGASAAGALMRLNYDVVSAEYDKPLDRLILVAANPNELHIYDPVTQTDQTVPLVKPPLSVSVRPDGEFAAVGHDGWVSYVNLETATVVRVFQVNTDVRSVILAGNGYMYLFPFALSLEISTGTITPAVYAGPQLEISTAIITPINAEYDARVPRLSRDGDFLYIGGSNEVSKYSISQGIAKIVHPGFNATYPCGNLWMSEDGRRLLTACASAYRTSSVPAEDMQFNGRLSGLSFIRWADHSAVRQSTAVLSGVSYSQAGQLLLYGDAFLELAGSLPLPQFTVGSALYRSYGQFVFWNSAATELVVVVKADAPASLTSPFGVSLVSPSTTGQTPFTIPNRGGVSLISAGGSQPTVGSGRIQLTINQANSAPAALAIFGSRQNGVLVSEATVPSSTPIQSGRIYAEVSGAVDTGLAIANPNSTPANVSFYFTDQNGTNFGSGTTTIPANGQIAKFLREAPFHGGVSVNGTFTFTSDVPVAAVALRGLINERSEVLWTTLPVSTIVGLSLVPPVFPNFADGGGWTSQFVLVNTSDTTTNGTLQFFSQGSATAAGTPVAVTVEGQTASTIAYSIPPRSSRKLRTSGSGDSVLVGSARVVPASGSFSRIPSGVAIFSQKNAAGTTITEAGVPTTLPAQILRLYAEASLDSSQIQTGIAVANTAPSPATVTLELSSLTGASIGLTGTLTVPANGQVQMFLNQIPGFANLPMPFKGVLRVSASSFVYVVGLRSRINERNEFLITTTSPVNESSIPATSDLMFPHLADGGGYTTQFILFSRASTNQTLAGILQFSTQTGQLLNLNLR